MKPWPLDQALDEALFGGKAASLARSLGAGLPVPPGFALGTTEVEAVFDGDAETLAQLREAFTGLGGSCAVRSSAIGEDSEGASFAGQHVTILNVRHEDRVADAVLEVRASAHTESARAYRRTLGMDETPRVGVVVQRMIEPDCAGVMFTKNPLNGSDERVIEASWGLGEAVVAGLVVPDNYVLDDRGRVGVVVQRMIEPDCAGVMFTKNPLNGSDERVIEASWGLGEAVVAGLVVPDNYVLDDRGHLVRRTAGEKDIALRGAPDGGTVQETVAEDLVTAFCLDDGMLAGLSDLAARCEAFFGKGLDIEWAFSSGTLYLLQCRAMTRNR